jgi:peptide deformylase
MAEHGGIGLTSNQIGLNLSAFAMIWDSKPIVVFNPEIIEYSDETTYFRELCLSYPGLQIAIRRSESIKAQFEVSDGSTKGAVFNGRSSRIFQHEMEHVRGREYFWEVSNFILKQAMKKRKHNLKKMRRDV